MITRVAHLAERSIRYLESGGGKPLVLIHAFPLSADQWLPQVSQTPPGWRIIAPDLRGFRGAGGGIEQAIPDEMTVDAYADDVLALMSHLEIDRAVVGGLSMGGYVTLALVRLAPARVSGLVLASTRAGADSAEGRAARDRMIALVQREGPEAVAREMVPKLLGATTRREQPDLEEVVRHLIEQNSTEAIAAAVRAMKRRPDSTPMLPSIDVPTLVLAGAEDAIIPLADAETMRDAIPRAQLVVLPRAGHLSNLEAPAAFAAALTGSEVFSTV